MSTLGGTQNIGAVATEYARLHAINSRPAFPNLTGLYIFDPLNQVCNGVGDYPTAPLDCYPPVHRELRWVSHDFYPVNLGSDIRTVARTIDKVTRWTPKPQFAFVEASPKIYNAATPGPTPGQLRAELWLAIIHGAHGITYFTYSFCGPDNSQWCPDGVMPDVAAEMTTQNARVTRLASVIQSASNPPAIGFSSVGHRSTGPSRRPGGSSAARTTSSCSIPRGMR